MAFNSNSKRHGLNSKGIPNQKSFVGEGEFVIVLPLTDNSGRSVKQKVYTKYIDKLNNRFGGNTSMSAKGCYSGDDKELQCEQNMVIRSFRDFQNPFMPKRNLSDKQKLAILRNDYNFMKKLGKEAQIEFGQEGITVMYNNINDATIIKGRKKSKMPDSKVIQNF